MPSKKFEFYLVRDEASMSLKVLRREGKKKRREGEREEERDRERGACFTLDSESRKTDLVATWRIYEEMSKR